MRIASIVLLISATAACGGGGSPPPLTPTEVPPTTTSAPAPSSPAVPATAATAAPSAPSTTAATLSAETARKGHAWVDAEAKRLTLLEGMTRTGRVSQADLSAASRDWIRACRESGMRGDELVTAAQKHLDRMNRTLDGVRAQYKAGAASDADVATAEGAVAEADFFLAQAKDAR
jgi:hypothetical protein